MDDTFGVFGGGLDVSYGVYERSAGGVDVIIEGRPICRISRP
jgi:hypothetical protein